jgi:hypothetical protein
LVSTATSENDVTLMMIDFFDLQKILFAILRG